jgi:hypothetical protein
VGESRTRFDSLIDDVGSVRRLRVRNRRALVRLSVDVPAVIEWSGHEHPGVVTDLAHGGLFVECDPKPDVATNVVVRVRVSGQLATFHGVVRWIGESGVGVQFAGLGEAEARAVSVLSSLPRPAR